MNELRMTVIGFTYMIIVDTLSINMDFMFPCANDANITVYFT